MIKKIGQIWNRMESSTKLAIGCFSLYMMLYLIADIVEEVVGLVM